MEARDQGQLDDLLQLDRQSHEKERDEGTTPRIIEFLFPRLTPLKGFILSPHRYSQICTSYSIYCSGYILRKNNASEKEKQTWNNLTKNIWPNGNWGEGVELGKGDGNFLCHALIYLH